MDTKGFRGHNIARGGHDLVAFLGITASLKDVCQHRWCVSEDDELRCTLGNGGARCKPHSELPVEKQAVSRHRSSLVERSVVSFH